MRIPGALESVECTFVLLMEPRVVVSRRRAPPPVQDRNEYLAGINGLVDALLRFAGLWSEVLPTQHMEREPEPAREAVQIRSQELAGALSFVLDVAGGSDENRDST